MTSGKQNDPTQAVDNPTKPTEEMPQQPAEKPGWRKVLAKVLPGKKAAKDKPSPNIYPLF